MKKKISLLLYLIIAVNGIAQIANGATVADVNHTLLQACNNNGQPVYDDTDKVSVEGIILNNPEYMLNPTPTEVGIGGQWQFFLQPDDPCDKAGTAVWMGQNYSRVFHIFSDYNDSKFIQQLCDMNYDFNSGYRFNAGDKVKVTGYYKAFGGKLNINEMHQVSDIYDVNIVLLEPAVGLPDAEVITLDMVKNSSDPNDYAFYESDRTKGCERYQARLVRVNDVNIVNPQNWAPNQYIQIKDSKGYTFFVKLGIGKGFELFDPPTGQIDVIGIFNQEHPGCTLCNDGYEIWVTNYDGNGLVLTDRGQQRGNIPGDVNFDAKLDLTDFAIMAQNWLNSVSSICDCQ